MSISDPKKTLHLLKLVPFAYVENYIKEIQLIDSTPRAILPVSVLNPYVTIVLNSQIAMRPKSIKFCGTYRETWEVCLN